MLVPAPESRGGQGRATAVTARTAATTRARRCPDGCSRMSRPSQVPGALHAGNSSGEHGFEMSGSVIALPFLLGCLTFGILAWLTHRKLHLPYTVLLLIGGVVCGSLHWADCDLEAHHATHGGVMYCTTWMGSFGTSLDAWSQIDPNIIVGVFLPILLFESAFSVDFHIFRHSLGKILLLAVPGVLMSSMLFGGFAVWAYSWEWPTAMMLGAILSATDPMAVVALMRDVGASKRLASLIEGESLINDGTAMLLFSLFKGMAFDGSTFSVSTVVVKFVRLAGGGAALGFVSSRLLAFLLSHIYNDPISETVMTLVFAYATFCFCRVRVDDDQPRCTRVRCARCSDLRAGYGIHGQALYLSAERGGDAFVLVAAGVAR